MIGILTYFLPDLGGYLLNGSLVAYSKRLNLIPKFVERDCHASNL